MKNNFINTILFIIISVKSFAFNSKENSIKIDNNLNKEHELIVDKLLSTKEFENLILDYSIISMSVGLSAMGDPEKMNEKAKKIDEILKTPYEYLTLEKKHEVANLMGYDDSKALENRINQMQEKKVKIQNLVPELSILPDVEKQEIINKALEKGKILEKIEASYLETDCVKKCTNDWYSCKRLNNVWRYVALGIMVVCFAAYLYSVPQTAGATLTLWSTAMLTCSGGAGAALGISGFTGNSGCNSDAETCLKLCHPEILAGGGS